MWKNIGLEQCLSFIQCQLSAAERARGNRLVRPAITISRMTGSGGRSVAAKLAEHLEARVPGHAPWTVFDRKLVEQMLEEHHLSKRIADYMPEDHKPMMTDILEELFGLHPSSWTLAQQTAETILHLADMGNVILVGHGAHVVTAKLANAFHVRLVGSVEKRTERVQQVYALNPRAALEFLRHEDKGRRHYLKEHFEKDIDDPLLYHLIVNTDWIDYDETAQLIGDQVIRRFHLDPRVEVAKA